MKEKQNKVQIAYRLPPELVGIIKDKAKNLCSTETYALEVIIREWDEYRNSEAEKPLLTNAELIRVKRTALQLTGSADRLAWILLRDVPTK